MKKLIALATLIICTGTVVKAQHESSGASQTTNLNLSNAISVEFVATGNSTGAVVNMTFSNVNDYANGVESGDVQMKVQSNKNFEVRAKSSSRYFTYSGTTSPAPQMEVDEVLEMKVTANNTGGYIDNGYSSYRDVEDESEDILDGCDNGGNQTFSVKYRARPGFNFPAGTYTTSIVYTVTQE